MATEKTKRRAAATKANQQPQPMLERNDIAVELIEARTAFPVVPGPNQTGVKRDDPSTAAKQELKKTMEKNKD